MAKKPITRKRDADQKRFADWVSLAAKRPDLIRVLRGHIGTIEQYQYSIAKACEKFNLDPKQSQDRDLLLAILADVHFPKYQYATNALQRAYRPPARRGSPVRWTEARIQTMIERLRDRVEAGGSDRVSDLADYLKTEFPKDHYPSKKVLERLLIRGPSKTRKPKGRE